MSKWFRRGLAAAAFSTPLLFSSNAFSFADVVPFAHCREKDKTYDVIVIGAGLAGLSAANTLLTFDPSTKLMILESRDRIGGRVYTHTNGVELGANWVHNLSEKNPLLEKIPKHMKVVETSCDDEPGDDVKLFDSSSNCWVSDSHQQTQFEKWCGLCEKLRDLFLDNDESVESVFHKHREPSMDKGIFNWCLERVGIAHALHTGDVSFNLWTCHENDGAEGEGVLDGSLTEFVVKPLGEKVTQRGGEITLNSAVTQIDWGQTPIVVHCDKKEYRAEKLIVALPLGVLQSGKLKFQPALPKSKTESLSRFQSGLLNVLILEFDKIYWPTDKHHNFFGVVNDELASEFGVTVALNLAALKSKPTPQLMFQLIGSPASHIETEEGREETTSIALATLRKMIPNLPKPKNVYSSAWCKDPHAMGSYAASVVGSSEQADFELMSEPVSQKLYFAGEYTYFDAPGTMHGAFLSGVREATRIYLEKKYGMGGKEE